MVVWGALVVNSGSWTPSRTLRYLATHNSLIMASAYGGRVSAALRVTLMGSEDSAADAFSVGKVATSSWDALAFLPLNFADDCGS